MRTVILLSVLALLGAAPAFAQATHFTGTQRTAASCSRADVNTQITAASDGDQVLIPNGTCTGASAWATGITTTKKIWIRAENYTETDEGTCTRNVTIQNNNSTTPALFEITTGNGNHVAISGIRFNEGTGSNNAIRVNGSGSKVALISDVCFEVDQRNGTATDISVLSWLAQGGVIWNTRFIQLAGVTSSGGTSEGPDGASFVLEPPTSWTSASTIGTADTNGTTNVYMEDSSCWNVGQFPDADDAARFVSRYNDLNGCSGTSHGISSCGGGPGPCGGRHVEYYNNVFTADADRNMAGRYYWLRGGTGVFTENSAASHGWGAIRFLDLGEQDETAAGECSSTWPCLESGVPSVGHNGSAYVLDPIYVWNQTGAEGSDVDCCWADWGDIIVEDRNYYVGDAKPSYTKYTYPHPLRDGEGGGEEGGGTIYRLRFRVADLLALPIVVAMIAMRRRIG